MNPESIRHPLPPTQRDDPSIRRVLQIGSNSSPEWTHYALPIRYLPESLIGLRIVQLSDLHVRRRWHRSYEILAERLRSNPPDLLLITGDLVHAHHAEPQVLKILRRLIAGLSPRPFAILGNHDGDLLAAKLLDMNVSLIDGRIVRLAHRDATIELIGIPGVWRTEMHRGFLQSIPPRIDHSVRIILSHFPDSIRDLVSLEADLVLTGHTHGGQICLPNGFAPLTHDSLPQRYSKGVFRWNDRTHLVVNRGFGFGSPQIRIFCPSEVIEIELMR